MIEMISSRLEGQLYSSNADTITGIFCWVILAIGIVALVCYKQDKARSFTHYTPNLLTSLGMLGTFIGIVIGLLHFDTTNIQDSIALLLDGLKTAFMTSLFGMALAMLYKITTGLKFMQPKTDVASGPDEVGPEHIHQVMLQQNEQLTKQAANLEKLHLAIAGDDSDTLTGQIRLLRQNQDDNHKALVREVDRQSTAAEALGTHAEAQRQRFDAFARELSEQMREFAEMMSKSATEQVIHALKEVIQDFNNQLTEQFGENFKALDASVKSLVEWQENYRQQLGEMRDQYAQGVTAITDTEKSVANISTSASAIPETMSGLETLLTATQRQLADLEAHLAAFADMRDKAVEAVPQINAQVEKTVADISQAALNAATQLVSGGEELKKELVDGTAKINAEMIEGASGLNERYNSVHQSLQGTSDHLANQSEQIAGQFRDAHETVNAQVREMVEHLQQQHEVMGKHLTEGNERIAGQLDEQHRQSAERFTALQSHLQGSADTLTQGTDVLNRQFLSGAEQLEKRFDEGAEGLGKQMQTSAENLEKQLREGAEGMTRKLSEGAEELGKDMRTNAEKMATEMREGTQGIGERFERLHATLEQNAAQLNQGAERLSETHRKGVETAEQQVKTLIDQLTQQSSQLTRTLGDAGEETQQQLRDSQAQAREQLATLQNQHREALEAASKQYQGQLSAAQQQLNGVLQDIVRDTASSLDQQVKNLDSTMQDELTRALTLMGNQLAQVTGRFTEDYTQLTNEMQKVVNQGSRAGAY